MDENVLRKILQEELGSFATKQDITNLVTKEDVNTLATKQDLDGLVSKENAKNFATKQDLELALKGWATKVIEDISDVVTKLLQQVDERKADKDQTFSLEVRVDKLERKVFPQ